VVIFLLFENREYDKLAQILRENVDYYWLWKFFRLSL